MEKKKRIKSNLMLLMTALIWGSAFVAQKSGAEVGAFAFNGIRSLIGGLALLPVIPILARISSKNTQRETLEAAEKRQERKALWLGGFSCGVVLFAASTLQQLGIQYTSAGKAGFITSLYTILVPVFALLLGKKVRPVIWLCMLLAMAGLYLLCVPAGESFRIALGDLLVLLCAAVFAIHILIIDYFSVRADGVKMSCIQFFVAGLLSLPCMFLFERPEWSMLFKHWFPILYAGMISCGIAYTLQIVAQKDADPTEASLILSLESVFSVLTGALLLGERMGARGILGCGLIFGAVAWSQIHN